jgi:hypothetical protein
LDPIGALMKLGNWIGNVTKVRSWFEGKSNTTLLVSTPDAKSAAEAPNATREQPAATAAPGQVLTRAVDSLRSAGVVFINSDAWTEINRTAIGKTFVSLAGFLANAASAVVNGVTGPAPPPPPKAQARAPQATVFLEDEANAERRRHHRHHRHHKLEPAAAAAPPPEANIRCYWVYLNSSANVPKDENRVNPNPVCWENWSWNRGSNKMCADTDLRQGPGAIQTAIAERYGRGFTCFSDEQRSTPGTKEGQRIDNVAFVCRDGNNVRVATPAKCQAKIYMQAAFYGEAKTSTSSSGRCPIGERKMNAFAGLEAAWTVNSKTLFNKGAMTQSGNEITEHYSVALGAKGTFTDKGPGGEVGVTVGMTVDVKDDFKDTNAACYVVASADETETVASILKSSGTVSMTAKGRVWGSCEVKTLGFGVWYAMIAKGETAADCKGATSTYNFYIQGNGKFAEMKETAKRFFAGKEMNPPELN